MLSQKSLLRSCFGRFTAKDFLMQRAVIFPRIDVSGNKRRINGHAENLSAMFVEQSTQASLRIKTQELISKTEIDENGVPTAAFILGRQQLC